MSIKLLPEAVAARIAAGEVVERPASVVKELLENSLDAGATRVEIETRAGGTELLRIRDNGSGIRSDEVELAFRRHSTSKLLSAADLDRIATLGFRGEALSSIASVSRCTCSTRHVTEQTGTRLRIEGGKIVHTERIGRPVGTELLIEDLFYNVPARRKFLASTRTERGRIDGFTTRYAIAYPDVAFYVAHDGRQSLNTPGNGNAKEALLSVYGMDLGGSLLPIDPGFAEGPISVRGFVGPTTVHRANRGYITLFINGRWITDMRITYAVIQAYHTLLPVKRYPVAFVQVEIEPEDVDVNVHPAKTEVRFREADAVFRAVQRAVRATVIEQAPVTASWQAPTSSGDDASMRHKLAGLAPAQTHFVLPEREQTGVATLITGSGPTWSVPENTESQTGSHTPESTQNTVGTTAIQSDERINAPPVPPSLPPLRVIGQASTMFIIAEGPDGLYLVDQHAAHERVLYEQMIGEWRRGGIPSQPLLEPVPVTLPGDEAVELEALLPTLGTMGLEVEEFGPGTFLVRALPALLTKVNAADLLADIAANEDERSPVQVALEERIIRRICKRVAVKAGQVLTREEMERLIRDLEHTRNPRTCPHGRPTILQLSTEALARQFGRMGF